MSRAMIWRGLSLVGSAACALMVTATIDQTEAAQNTDRIYVAQAEPSNVEKQAFDSAKDLGTVEAWDAFLSAYPSGFYADLARAYVKKLAGPAETPPAAAKAPAATLLQPSIGMLSMAPPSKSVTDMPTAAKRPCSERADLRSQSSDTAARITFINYGKDPIEVYWLDDKGQKQLFGEIKQDRQAAVETFLTHVWMVTDLEANCLALALPSPGPQVFVVERDDADDAPAATTKSYSKPKSKPASNRSCSSGQIRVDGRCITKKQAVSFCGPGFKARNGKCVSRSDSPPAAPSKSRCPKGQIYSQAEGCHYDD